MLHNKVFPTCLLFRLNNLSFRYGSGTYFSDDFSYIVPQAEEETDEGVFLLTRHSEPEKKHHNNELQTIASC